MGFLKSFLRSAVNFAASSSVYGKRFVFGEETVFGFCSEVLLFSDLKSILTKAEKNPMTCS